MNKKFLYIFLILIMGIAVFAPADSNANGTCPPGAVCIENPLIADTFEELIDNIITFIFIFALAFAPLMFIIAGFFFITAAGDPKKIQTAQTMIWYTLVGLAIVILAKGIIKVIQDVLGG